MPEVTHAGEHHRQATFVGGGYHIGITHRTAGVNGGGDAGIGGDQQGIGKWEESIRGAYRALCQ